MSVNLTEQTIVAMVPNDKALLDGRGLIKKGALKKLAKNEDGSLVFGLCQGTGKLPYEVSMDLATGTDRPTLRCSCPSRQFPCKHQISLMLAFVASGTAFPVQEPPAGLLEKRSKLFERAEKKAAAPAKEAAPRKVDKAAQAKKAREQGEALDTLETFVLDLVAAGLGGLTDNSVKAIDNQAKRMADADMRGASATLQRLSALIASDGRAKGGDVQAGEGRGISEARQAKIGLLVTQLWVTLRKGRKVIEGKLDEGVSQAEADAQVESVLGRAWKLPELKEAGYWVTDRTLIELAHERSDDPVTDFQSASGFLLDLADGSIVEEQTSLPASAIKFGGKLRSSRAGVVTVKEAALYPGEVVNRRIRWDDKLSDNVAERPRTPADYAALHAASRSLEVLTKLFRGQLKNPLQPSDAVVLMSVGRIGTVDGTLVADDNTGARIALRDREGSAFPTALTLRTAVGGFGPDGAAKAHEGPFSLVLRLFFDARERAVFGQPLALIAGTRHLRLGM